MSLALPGGPSAPKAPLLTTPSAGNLNSTSTRTHLLAQRISGKAKESIIRGHSSPLLLVSQDNVEKEVNNGPQNAADLTPVPSLKMSTDSATDHGLHDLDAFWKNQADAIGIIGRSGSLQIFGNARSRPILPTTSASPNEPLSSARSGPDSARSEGDVFRTSHKRSLSDISRLAPTETRQGPASAMPSKIHRFGAEDVVLEVDTASSTSEDALQFDSRAISPIEVGSSSQTASPMAAGSAPTSSPSGPFQISSKASSSTSANTSTISSPYEGIETLDNGSDLSPESEATPNGQVQDGLGKPVSSQLSTEIVPPSPLETPVSIASAVPATYSSPSKSRNQLSNSPSLPEVISPALASSPPKVSGFSHRASVHLSGLFDRSGVLDLHSPNPNPTSIRADFSSFLKSGNVDTSGSVQDTEALMPDSDVDYPVPAPSEEAIGLEDEEESPLFDLAEWKRTSASDHITTIDSHGLTISRHMTLKELQEMHGDAIQANLASVSAYDLPTPSRPLPAHQTPHGVTVEQVSDGNSDLLEGNLDQEDPSYSHSDSYSDSDSDSDSDLGSDSDDSEGDIHRSWGSASANSTIRISGSVSMEVRSPPTHPFTARSSSSNRDREAPSRVSHQMSDGHRVGNSPSFEPIWYDPSPPFEYILSSPKGRRSFNHDSIMRESLYPNPPNNDSADIDPAHSHRRRTSSSSSAEDRRSKPMLGSPPPLTASSHVPAPRPNHPNGTASSNPSPLQSRLPNHHHQAKGYSQRDLLEPKTPKGSAAPPPSPNVSVESSSPFSGSPLPSKPSGLEPDSRWICELSESLPHSRKGAVDRYPILSTSPTPVAQPPPNQRILPLSSSTSTVAVLSLSENANYRPMGSETAKMRRRRSSGRSSPQSISSASSMTDVHAHGNHLRPPTLKLVPSSSSERVADEATSRSSSRQSSLLSPHFADSDSDSSEEGTSPFVRLGRDGKKSMKHPHGNSVPDLDALGPAPRMRSPLSPYASNALQYDDQHHTTVDDIVTVMNSLAIKSTDKDLSRHRRHPSQTKLERRLREVERRLELLEKCQAASSESSVSGATGNFDGYTSLRASIAYGPVLAGSSPGSVRRGRSNTIATVTSLSQPVGGSTTSSTQTAGSLQHPSAQNHGHHTNATVPTSTATPTTTTHRTATTYTPNDNAYNRRFQEIMQLSGPIKYIQMAALGRDFVQLAEVYGRIIISERCLPPEQKSIKPVALGGQAGGSKFMVQGILFKYAMDVRLAAASGREKWLYGGKRRDDGAAIKAASNELLGLSSFVKCNSNNIIRFPLMSLIDYCGFRLVAVSTLPINVDTIVYGSADAGRSVHNKDETAIRAMHEFGHDLNLREHMVFNTPIMGPGDLEVHRGFDGNLYMIDFARTFPPEAPGEFAHPQSIFYKLLRPELVRGNDRPLSSDAFSGWQSSDSKSDAMNEDVEEATKRLLETVIPAYPQTFLAPDFQVHFRSEVCNISDLHRRGINLRHLGRVRSEMYKVTEDNDSLYLVEMICRTLKSYIAMRFRTLMDDLIIFAEEPFRNEALMLFNLVAQPSTAADFWHVRVKSLIQRKYGTIALRPEELDPQVMLLNVLPKEHRLYLVRRLAWHLCVIFDDNIWDNFQEALNSSAEFEFFPQDIKEIKPRIKYMTILDLALGITLYMQAAGAVDASRNEANILLLQEAKICLVNSWTRISDCLVTRYFLAKVWYLMGKLKSDGADDFARALVMIESTMVEERDRADLRLDFAKAGVMAYIHGREPERFEQALIHYREVTKSHPPLALTLRNDVLAWMSNQHGNKAVNAHQFTMRINATHSVMRLLLTDPQEYDAFCIQLNAITSKPRNWQTPLSRSSFSGRMFTS